MNFPIKTLFSSQVAELRSTKEQLKAKQDELVAERDSSRKEKEARAEEVICALLINLPDIFIPVIFSVHELADKAY